MAGFWSDWANVRDWGTESPYVNWWHVSPPAGFSEDKGAGRSLDAFTTYLQGPFGSGLSRFLSGRASDLTWGLPIGDEHRRLRDAFGEVVPMPGNVINKDFDAYLAQNKEEWTPPDDVLPVVDPETVIVGIIDSGIPIGSSRLRDKEGKDARSCVLAAGRGSPGLGRRRLYPCGSELYQAGIDELIRNHTIGDYFLADDFNCAAGLVDMKSPLGTRVLAGRYAHGAMVADLAAGADPAESEDRVKVIAVNLPNLATLNSSGIFLDYFTILGIRRIADLADSIFNKSKALAGDGSPKNWPKDGLPIVINLSFGKNAGSKDGHDLFSASITLINQRRKKEGKRPIVVVTPVGNHNLEQANARFQLEAGGTDSITFRASPEDQTPNYLEVWSDPIPLEPDQLLSDVRPPLAIEVTPPGAVAMEASAGGHRELRKAKGDVARMYCEWHPDATGTRISHQLSDLHCALVVSFNERADDAWWGLDDRAEERVRSADDRAPLRPDRPKHTAQFADRTQSLPRASGVSPVSPDDRSLARQLRRSRRFCRRHSRQRRGLAPARLDQRVGHGHERHCGRRIPPVGRSTG